jgi:hypothetical protein
MLRSEAITIIKRGLGFRQTQDAAIVAALKQAQRDLEAGKTLPEWLMTTTPASITVTPGNAFIVLPVGFLRLHDDHEMYYLNSGGAQVFLPRRNYSEAYEAQIGSLHDPDSVVTPSTGVYPQVVVYLSNTRAQLFPTPTATTLTSVKLDHYAAAAVLDSEMENAWLKYAANYLVGMAGLQVAGDLRDRGAADKFSMMMKMGAQAYFAGVVDAELAGRPLIMGRNN